MRRQLGMLESISTSIIMFSQLPRLERDDWHSFHRYKRYNYGYIPLLLQLERGTPGWLYRNFVPIELLEELFPLVPVEVEMFCHFLLRHLCEPLLGGKVFEFGCSKHLQHLELAVTDIFDIVRIILGYDTDISSHVVERSGFSRGSKDRYSSMAFEEETPLVCIGVPMHFSHTSFLDGDMSGGCRLGDGEIGRIGDPNGSTGEFERFLLQHTMRKAVSR